MKTVLLVVTVLLLIEEGYCHVDPRKNVYNKDHIREELNDVLSEEDISNTDFENTEMMELHYFKLHDTNKDNKLDGIELGAAMTHYHDEDENGKKRVRRVEMTDEELSDLIKQILKDDDANDDGYIDFYEFVTAQRKGSTL